MIGTKVAALFWLASLCQASPIHFERAELTQTQAQGVKSSPVQVNPPTFTSAPVIITSVKPPPPPPTFTSAPIVIPSVKPIPTSQQQVTIKPTVTQEPIKSTWIPTQAPVTVKPTATQAPVSVKPPPVSSAAQNSPVVVASPVNPQQTVKSWA